MIGESCALKEEYECERECELVKEECFDGCARCFHLASYSTNSSPSSMSVARFRSSSTLRRILDVRRRPLTQRTPVTRHRDRMCNSLVDHLASISVLYDHRWPTSPGKTFVPQLFVHHIGVTVCLPASSDYNRYYCRPYDILISCTKNLWMIKL